jgi:hypothetical protein
VTHVSLGCGDSSSPVFGDRVSHRKEKTQRWQLLLSPSLLVSCEAVVLVLTFVSLLFLSIITSVLRTTMPVLELLLLRLRPGISPNDPTLVENLSTVRSLVHTNSRFYHCIEDPTLVYILGQWPSIASHKVFLSSPEKDAILSHQTHQLDFVWMLHLDLPEGKSMEDVLPFTAPVLGIARMFFNTSDPDVDVHKKTLVDHRSNIVGATNPYPLFDAWRIDAQEGQAEYVILTGWESVEAHIELTSALSVSNREHATGYMEVEVRHMRNLEA